MKRFRNRIVCGDSFKLIKEIPAASVDVVITSPPYWALRDYGVNGQIGLESNPADYVRTLADFFKLVKQVLKKTGSLWLNLGDTYYGSGKGRGGGTWTEHSKHTYKTELGNRDEYHIKPPKRLRSNWLQPKQKLLIPERVAIALQGQGWILRNKIVWFKPNHMPSSVKDRLTCSYDNVFFFVATPKYYFNLDAIREKPTSKPHKRRVSLTLRGKHLQLKKHDVAIGRTGSYSYTDPLHTKEYNPAGKNPGDVWQIPTQPFKDAHFATFPEELVKRIILSCCPKNGLVLDPFAGSGTTCLVARKLTRNYIGIDLNPKYVEMANKRLLRIPRRLDLMFKG